MFSKIRYSFTIATLVILIPLLMFRLRKSSNPKPVAKPHPLATVPPEQLPEYIQKLLAELPSCVILQSYVVAFQQAVDYSWGQQNREIIPVCVVRPGDAAQLSKAVTILKEEHDRRDEFGASANGFFAIRSGAGNPGIGAATIQDGTLIDLSLLCEVTPAVDGSTVTVGTGAK